MIFLLSLIPWFEGGEDHTKVLTCTHGRVETGKCERAIDNVFLGFGVVIVNVVYDIEGPFHAGTLRQCYEGEELALIFFWNKRC